MSDDKVDRGEPDRSRINLNEEYEVRYWREKLGITKEELVDAVRKVDDSPKAARELLAA
jgi:hypothetical protein